MINYIPLELDYLTVFLVFVMILLKIQWFSLTLQRITRLPVQPSAVSAQCCRTIHRRPATLGPHHWHTRQLPLVESPRSCSVLYKLATVVYCSLTGAAPSYLAKDLRRLSDGSRPGDGCGHHWPISWMFASRRVQQLETDPLCWCLVVEQFASRHCCVWHTSTVPPRT